MVHVAIDLEDQNVLENIAKKNGIRYPATIIGMMMEECLAEVCERHGWKSDYDLSAGTPWQKREEKDNDEGRGR